MGTACRCTLRASSPSRRAWCLLPLIAPSFPGLDPPLVRPAGPPVPMCPGRGPPNGPMIAMRALESAWLWVRLGRKTRARGVFSGVPRRPPWPDEPERDAGGLGGMPLTAGLLGEGRAPRSGRAQDGQAAARSETRRPQSGRWSGASGPRVVGRPGAIRSADAPCPASDRRPAVNRPPRRRVRDPRSPPYDARGDAVDAFSPGPGDYPWPARSGRRTTPAEFVPGPGWIAPIPCAGPEMAGAPPRRRDIFPFLYSN